MGKNGNKSIKDITDNLTEEVIKNATDEELMGYLFLAEKMKKKLQKAYELEEEIELEEGE